MLAQATPLCFDLTGNLGVDQRAVGRQGYDEAGVGGMACDVEDVGAKKRFAAGEDKDRAREGGDLVDELERFVGFQVLRHQLVGNRNAPAVDTGKVTARSRLPKDEAGWRVVRIVHRERLCVRCEQALQYRSRKGGRQAKVSCVWWSVMKTRSANSEKI